jgi:hypothetical protein
MPNILDNLHYLLMHTCREKVVYISVILSAFSKPFGSLGLIDLWGGSLTDQFAYAV